MENFEDLYTDYLISSTSYTTATGMASLLSIKHDKHNKKYGSIETLQSGKQTVEVWFEELDFLLLPTEQVFKNENDTVGELYLACNDLNLSYFH